MSEQEELMEQLLEVALLMRKYIDAIPKDIEFPAMPGFDRDWADSVIDDSARLLAQVRIKEWEEVVAAKNRR